MFGVKVASLTRLLGLALVVSVLWGGVSAVDAQSGGEPSDAEFEEARGLFLAGEAAVRAHRWADAVRSFSRAYQLSQVPAALYNVGFAQRALGQHREARDAFTRLIEQHADFDEGLLEEAEQYRDEAEDRIAVLIVTALDPGLRYRVGVDGESVDDDGQRPLSVELNPGPHTVAIRIPDVAPYLWEGSLEEGERLTVEAEFAAPVSGGGEEDPDEGGSIFGSPWFWATTGAVLLIAGGVLFFYHQSLQLDPNSERTVEL